MPPPRRNLRACITDSGVDKITGLFITSARICQIATNTPRLRRTIPILPGIESTNETSLFLRGAITGVEIAPVTSSLSTGMVEVFLFESALNAISHCLPYLVFLCKVRTEHSLLHNFLLKEVPTIVSQLRIFRIQPWVVIPTILRQIDFDNLLDHARPGRQKHDFV